jgi:hypothetical protein
MGYAVIFAVYAPIIKGAYIFAVGVGIWLV